MHATSTILATGKPTSDVRTPRSMRRTQDVGAGVGSIALRAPNEIAAIRAAGDVLYAALEQAAAACVAGATTADVDAAAMRVIEREGATALFRGYASAEPGVAPFPACCCVSVNDEVVHGVPGPRVLRDGDIVSIDCGVRRASSDAPSPHGWCADAAVTVPVGSVADPLLRLVECAQDMVAAAVSLATPGERWSEIAAAMQSIAIERGFGIVAEYVGHGIGLELHEAPHVPNCLSTELLQHGDFTLRPGMVLAVEPIITLPSAGRAAGVDANGCAVGVATRRCADGWTVATADGSVAAHAEHTIAITRRGCEVLTLGRGQSLSTHTTLVNPVRPLVR